VSCFISREYVSQQVGLGRGKNVAQLIPLAVCSGAALPFLLAILHAGDEFGAGVSLFNLAHGLVVGDHFRVDPSPELLGLLAWVRAAVSPE
jgi:hypothetical protein